MIMAMLMVIMRMRRRLVKVGEGLLREHCLVIMMMRMMMMIVMMMVEVNS